MRLNRLALGGLFLFDTPIELNAAELPRGLVAIVGPNGEGKTGLIETVVAVLHREYASKPGEVYAYATTREAFAEGDFTIDGVGDVRARLNVDPINRKYAGVISQRNAAGVWQPQTDGKMSSYDAKVRELFPSLNVLLATAFASQNRRGSFSDLSQADRKKLFAELLGLGRYEAWSAGCAEIVRAIDRRRAILKPWAFRLAAETGPIVEVAARELAAALEAVAALEAAGADLARRRVDADAALLEARTAAAAVAGRQTARAAALGRAEAARADLARDAQEQQAIRGRGVRGRQEIATRLSASLARNAAAALALPVRRDVEAAADRQICAMQAERVRDVEQLRTRIANNQQLIDQTAAIVKAGADLDALEVADRAAAAVEHGAAEAVHAAGQQLEAARGVQRREQRWPDQLAAAQRAAALIDRVPFGDKCAEAGCAFVQEAVTARASLADCEAGAARAAVADVAVETAEAARRTAEWQQREAAAELRRIRQAIEVHAQQKTRDRGIRLAHASTRLTELEAEIAAREDRDRRDVAALEQQTQQRVADLERARGALDTEAAQLREQAAVDTTASQAGEAADLEALEARTAATRRSLEQLAAELRQLEAGADHDVALLEARDAAERTIADLVAEELRIGTAAGAARATLTQAQELQQRLEARQREKVAIDAALERLAMLESRWAFLQLAFGRDGLPNLEIDAAGPIITDLANDLLRTGFGEQRFTIEIVTQQAKAKGGLKESFEMQVYDSRGAGKPRDLGMLSGGQRVIVDEAVKCALALYVNDHTRAKLRTCFRDETTGMLYPEFIPRYIEMLRRVQARGEFGQLFFCTHSPVAAQMADAQIVVDKGTLTIKLPPYDDRPPAPWVDPVAEERIA